MSHTRIMIVDGEPLLVRTVRASLAACGYDVVTATSVEEAVAKAQDGQPDLIILDLTLPERSGLDICRALRGEASTPILALAAEGDVQLKLHVLDLGADDCLTKPFGVDELLARTRALLRQTPTAPGQGDFLRAGDLAIDLGAHQAILGDVHLDLTRREFEVLAYLVRHAGRLITHERLLEVVWGPDYAAEIQYLRVFINRLRRKIEDDPAHPQRIVTSPGVGYQFLPPAQGSRDGQPAPHAVTVVGDMRLDYSARQVSRAGIALRLSPREFAVLAYLLQHASEVVTHRQLLEAVWGPAFATETAYLRVFINRLRRKIEDDPAHPTYIVTALGVGYLFVPVAADQPGEAAEAKAQRQAIHEDGS